MCQSSNECEERDLTIETDFCTCLQTHTLKITKTFHDQKESYTKKKIVDGQCSDRPDCFSEMNW